jgi:hypothetical protein
LSYILYIYFYYAISEGQKMAKKRRNKATNSLATRVTASIAYHEQHQTLVMAFSNGARGGLIREKRGRRRCLNEGGAAPASKRLACRGVKMSAYGQLKGLIASNSLLVGERKAAWR